MIINIHDHPYDMKSSQILFQFFSKFATERHYLDGTIVDRGGFVQTPEESIKEMDEAGVDKTVILNSCAIPNEHIYETYLKPYPGRFIGFTGSSPVVRDANGLSNNSFNQKNWEDTRRSISELGFKGMKLLPAYEHYSAVDPRVYPFYALAADLNVPIIMHMAGTPVRFVALQHARPIDADRVLFDFPTLRFNLPHMGWPWEDELLAMMVRSPNLYTDISQIGETGLKRTAKCLITARDFGVLSRVMFGTDPLCRPIKMYIDFIKNGINKVAAEQGERPFTEDEINGILGGTALKFLGLNPETTNM
jgi:predicted TIM-barrel fold metal-dependent hydrolase